MSGRPLVPTSDTALVVTVALPDALDELRRREIADANEGVPPHITLLYPFAPLAALDEALLDEIAGIVAGHVAFAVRLTEGRRWPDTLYAAVEPVHRLRALQGDLAARFPSLPLYGGAHAFEPHVSIVEGEAVGRPDALDDPAWGGLPVEQSVAAVDLIAKVGDRWETRRRFPLRDAAEA